MVVLESERDGKDEAWRFGATWKWTTRENFWKKRFSLKFSDYQYSDARKSNTHYSTEELVQLWLFRLSKHSDYQESNQRGKTNTFLLENISARMMFSIPNPGNQMKPVVPGKHEIRRWEKLKLEGFSGSLWTTRYLMRAMKSMIFLLKTLFSRFNVRLGSGWRKLNLRWLRPKRLKPNDINLKSNYWKIQTVKTPNQEPKSNNFSTKQTPETWIKSFATLMEKIKSIVLGEQECEYRAKTKTFLFAGFWLSGFWCKQESQRLFSWELFLQISGLDWDLDGGKWSCSGWGVSRGTSSELEEKHILVFLRLSTL